jgi:hypothetical protein
VANPGQGDADNDGTGDHCDSGDFDGDGYTDEEEARFIGTTPGYPCGFAGWPSNVWDEVPSFNELDISDVTSFMAPTRRLDTSPGDDGFVSRYDLTPGPLFPTGKHINIQDLTTLFNGSAGSPAYPPMFHPNRAFGRVCPQPP